MQLDFFNKPEPEPQAIELQEHAAANYVKRTIENAHKADLTIAFAMDYQSAGEKLTHKAAGQKYVAIPLNLKEEEAAKVLAACLNRVKPATVNIAGNGLYTLSKTSYLASQHDCNLKIFNILKKAFEASYFPKLIRSGGQTGADQAGLVSAIAMGIPALGLYPKGFRRRNKEGIEIFSDKESIKKELISEVDAVLQQTNCAVQ